MSVAYPSTFPLPASEGYLARAEVGADASDYRPGRTAVKRRYSRSRQRFGLEFVIAVAELDTWLDWVEANAWKAEGISLGLVSFASTTDSADVTAHPHEIRFTGELGFTYREDSSVIVRVDAEGIAGGDGELPLTGSFYTDEIDGGSPASPSSADEVDGGSPASPSADDTVEAGSPANEFGESL